MALKLSHHSFLLIGGEASCLKEIESTVKSVKVSPADLMSFADQPLVTIDDVRRIAGAVSLAPHSSSVKLVILPAHRLGFTAAQAVLKVLEEPPAHTVFMLYASNDKLVLPTILSRCRRVYVGGYGKGDGQTNLPAWQKVAAMSVDERFELAGKIAQESAASQALDQWIVEVYDESLTEHNKRLLDRFLTVKARLASSTNVKLHLEALFYSI